MNKKNKHLILAVGLLTVMLAVPFLLPSEESDGSAVGTVTFQPNFPTDATSKIGSAKSVPFMPGNEIELPTKLFSCGNYMLAGWGTSSSGGVTFMFEEGKKYTVKSGNATLYALWTAINPNGGNFDSDAPSTAAVNSVYLYEPAKDNKFNTEWVFVKDIWYNFQVTTPSWLTATWHWTLKDIKFTGSPPAPGNYYVEARITNVNKCIYWTINVPSETDNSYTISYDLNGGSGISPPSTTGTYAQATTLSKGFVGTTEITKPGHTLGGWDIPDRFGELSTYPLGAQYGLYKNVTAKAHWVSDPNVIVFSMDGGSLANVEAYITDTGEYYSLPSSSNALKDGNTLIGWHVTGSTGAVYAPGYLMKVSGSVKLEAHFVSQSQVSSLKRVTFDYTEGTGPVSYQLIESGKHVYLPDAGCERSGHTFQGWSLTRGGQIINYDMTLIQSDTILYAAWKENSVSPEPGDDPLEWKVEFDPNGGNTSAPKQTVFDKGFAYQPNGVTKEGHILTGWYSNIKGGLWDFSTDQVTQNITLVAQWAIHFTYVASGLNVKLTIEGIYAENADINWGDGTGTKTVTGYAEHDYKGSNYASRIVVTSIVNEIPYTSYLPLSGLDDHVVPITRKCTVTYDTQGGHPDTWIETVDRLSAAPRPDDPTKDGCTFLGWYLNGIEYEFTAPVESDLWLTAKWRDDATGEIEIHTSVIKPVANGTVTKTPNGWRFDASNSALAVLYQWNLSGPDRDRGPWGDKVVNFVGSLEPGDYTATLKVTSQSGHTDSKPIHFTVQADSSGGDGEKDNGDRGWFGENIVLICAAAIVVGIIVVRFVL